MEEIGQRLKQILNDVGLNTAAFAEKVGIQRSSLSHLFSGRNKPSVDLLLKVKKQFPETDLEWLITGEKKRKSPKASIENQESIENEPKKEVTNVTSQGVSIDNQGVKANVLNVDAGIKKTKDIERVILFYTDGSFKEYKND